MPRIPASGCRSGRRSAVQARAGRGLAPASRLAWFVLSLALLAGTSLVLLPAVATSMQVAMARSAAGICSVHPASAAFPASEEGGRSHSTHALDCVVCVFAAAGAADGAKHVPTIVEAVRATHPDVATLSRALPPAFLYPPGQAPPAHA
ncbi:MAG: DUF2946 family protein [bacterium]|nr:DUF2946 family protein [Betaproteobacteria bacterium]